MLKNKRFQESETDEGNDDLQKGIALSLQDQQKIKGFQESETLQGMRLHTGSKPYQIINAISAISVLKNKRFQESETLFIVHSRILQLKNYLFY